MIFPKTFHHTFFFPKKDWVKERRFICPVSVSTKQKTVFSGDNVNNVRGWIIYEMYISSVCRRVESYKKIMVFELSKGWCVFFYFFWYCVTIICLFLDYGLICTFTFVMELHYLCFGGINPGHLFHSLNRVLQSMIRALGLISFGQKRVINFIQTFRVWMKWNVHHRNFKDFSLKKKEEEEKDLFLFCFSLFLWFLLCVNYELNSVTKREFSCSRLGISAWLIQNMSIIWQSLSWSSCVCILLFSFCLEFLKHFHVKCKCNLAECALLFNIRGLLSYIHSCLGAKCFSLMCIITVHFNTNSSTYRCAKCEYYYCFSLYSGFAFYCNNCIEAVDLMLKPLCS